MKLTNEDVRDILALLDATGYEELRLRTERFILTLRRHGEGWTQALQTLEEPRLLQGVAEAPGSEDAAETPPTQAAEDTLPVRPPLLGTFYRAPKPGAPPFVQVGSRVGPDTVVGIVETMKLMTPVVAGAAGEVIEICAADAQFVEQDAVLMRLRPA